MSINKTKIPWCDVTWNPFTGCSPASEGCQNCYAAGMAKRFHRPWGKPVFHFELIDDVRKMVTRKYLARHGRQRIFVCSVSDLFHAEIKPEDRMLVLEMAKAFSCFHTFIFLTKRADIMHDELWRWRRERHMYGQWPNVWAGVTAENQGNLDVRVPAILDLDWCTRFVSLEPLLGPVNVAPYLLTDAEKAQHDRQYIAAFDTSETNKLDWVIAGPENGAKRRPCDPNWLHDIEADCNQYGTPFFDKREGGTRQWPKGGGR